MARWIGEAVENLSRRNPKISMDRESVKIYQKKRKKGSVEGNLLCVVCENIARVHKCIYDDLRYEKIKYTHTQS